MRTRLLVSFIVVAAVGLFALLAPPRSPGQEAKAARG